MNGATHEADADAEWRRRPTGADPAEGWTEDFIGVVDAVDANAGQQSLLEAERVRSARRPYSR